MGMKIEKSVYSMTKLPVSVQSIANCLEEWVNEENVPTDAHVTFSYPKPGSIRLTVVWYEEKP